MKGTISRVPCSSGNFITTKIMYLALGTVEAVPLPNAEKGEKF